MSKKVRTLLTISGLVIFLSWGFRLYVLYTHRNDDPLILPHLLVAFISFGIGAFLLSMAFRGKKVLRRDYTVLIYTSFFTVIWWGYRWIKVMLFPEDDPNARSHLHLASLYLVLGGLLLMTGFKGKNRKNL